MPVEMKTLVGKTMGGSFDAFLGGWKFGGKPRPQADLRVRDVPSGRLEHGPLSIERGGPSLRGPRAGAGLAAGLKPLLDALQREIHEDQPYTFLYETKRARRDGTAVFGASRSTSDGSARASREVLGEPLEPRPEARSFYIVDAILVRGDAAFSLPASDADPRRLGGPATTPIQGPNRLSRVNPRDSHRRSMGTAYIPGDGRRKEVVMSASPVLAFALLVLPAAAEEASTSPRLVGYVNSSSGLEVPGFESGDTEFEMADVNGRTATWHPLFGGRPRQPAHQCERRRDPGLVRERDRNLDLRPRGYLGYGGRRARRRSTATA